MQEDWNTFIKNPDEFCPIVQGSTISYMRQNPFDDPLIRDSNDLRCLIFPGYDELLDRDPGPRARAEKTRLWKDAECVITNASDVVFIGYSLPHYDSEAAKILKPACSGKTLVVCNPSEDVVAQFREVFKESDVIAEPCKFEESRFAVRRVH